MKRGLKARMHNVPTVGEVDAQGDKVRETPREVIDVAAKRITVRLPKSPAAKPNRSEAPIPQGNAPIAKGSVFYRTADKLHPTRSSEPL